MCWMTVAVCVGWWLVASTLLWATWNHVVAALTKAKKAKIWQALLLVATLCALGAPRVMMRHHGGCGQHHCEKGSESCEKSDKH